MSAFCALACNNCGNKTMGDLRYLRLNTAPCRNYIDDDRCDSLAKEVCSGLMTQMFHQKNTIQEQLFKKRQESVWNRT